VSRACNSRDLNQLFSFFQVGLFVGIFVCFPLIKNLENILYIPNFLHAVACEILVVTKTQKAIFLHNTKKFVVENLLVFGVDLRLRQN
jgi:hypothetical protein